MNLNKAKNLTELHQMLLNATDGELEKIDFSSLPTFSDNEPDDTTAIWSWDDLHILKGVGSVQYWDILQRPLSDVNFSGMTIESWTGAFDGDLEIKIGGEWFDCDNQDAVLNLLDHIMNGMVKLEFDDCDNFLIELNKLKNS